MRSDIVMNLKHPLKPDLHVQPHDGCQGSHLTSLSKTRSHINVLKVEQNDTDEYTAGATEVRLTCDGVWIGRIFLHIQNPTVQRRLQLFQFGGRRGHSEQTLWEQWQQTNNWVLFFLFLQSQQCKLTLLRDFRTQSEFVSTPTAGFYHLMVWNDASNAVNLRFESCLLVCCSLTIFVVLGQFND